MFNGRFLKNTRPARRDIEVALRREGGIAMTTVAGTAVEPGRRLSRGVWLEPELEVARALVEARTRGVHPSRSWRQWRLKSAVARIEMVCHRR